jgi:hypothetical protein
LNFRETYQTLRGMSRIKTNSCQGNLEMSCF